MKKYIVEKEDGKKVIVDACSSLDAVKKVIGKDKLKDSDQSDILNEIKSKYPGVRFTEVNYSKEGNRMRFRFIIMNVPSNVNENLIKYPFKKKGFEDILVGKGNLKMYGGLYVEAEGYKKIDK